MYSIQSCDVGVCVMCVAVAVDDAVCHDVLTFHERCGSLVKLSNGGCTAARQRPLDEFNNGVIMTARPLHSDERFEVSTNALPVSSTVTDQCRHVTSKTDSFTHDTSHIGARSQVEVVTRSASH